MKNISLAVFSAALLASSAWAASGAPAQNAPYVRPHYKNPRSEATMIATFKAATNPTADQEAQYLSALKTKNAANQAIQRDVNTNFQRLAEQVKNHASDSELQATLAAISSLSQARTDAYQKFLAKTAAILSPTQQVQLLIYQRATAPVPQI